MRKQMFENKCRLCGGKVSRGICVECGLDQRKTHATIIKDYDDEKSDTATPPNYKQKAKLLKWGVIILVGGNILGGLVGMITSSFSRIADLTEQEVFFSQEEIVSKQEEIVDNCNYLFHAFQTAEITNEYATDNITLPTSGETFTISLESGFYEVGVDLPTGIYQVEGMIDSAIQILNEDYKKSSYDIIYDDQVVDGGKSYPVEVYLMEGTVFYISDGEFQFTSELADVVSMEPIEEAEITDKYYITETELVGVNIPEGFYDISVPNNHRSWSEVIYPNDEDSNSIILNLNTYQQLEEYDTRKEVIRNVPLWEGITLELQQDDILILTPTTRSIENIKDKYEDFVIRSW